MKTRAEFDILLAKAQKDDPEAQYKVADLYFDGNGIDVNYQLGLYWGEKAAKNGQKLAQLQIGHWLVEEASSELPNILPEDSQLYEYCSIYSLDQLLSYDDKESVPLSLKEEVYDMSFEKIKHYPSVQEAIKKLEVGLNWIEKSSLQGVSQAQLLLGKLCLRRPPFPYDVHKAVTFLEMASSQHDTQAMFLLAMIHYKGFNGLMIDQKKALGLLYLAASFGHPNAFTNLAVLILQGKLNEDKETAIEYLRTAASTGNPEAMLNLAINLYLGNGVERNREEAIDLCKQVTFFGFKMVEKLLDKMLSGADDLSLEEKYIQ
ncbi:MAG: SEL1-like repeat protein [Deltaproteobacteria bacterium]|nr:SEL1-like repeat protein [Deltaproteobacteria bacterium]